MQNWYFYTKRAVIGVATLVIMAALDYTTGNEAIFSAGYIVPVSLFAWHFRRAVVLAMAFAGGVATWIVDALSGTPYSHFLFHYWNAFSCFLVSAIMGLVLYRLRQTLKDREEKNVELRQTLKSLQNSTEEIRRLQAGLQTVCAWTNNIKVGSQWMSPDQFLTEKLQLKITHGISPDGVKRFEADATGSSA